MAKSLTDQFSVSKKRFKSTLALDVILDVDANYFIDPALLKICSIAEFSDAVKVVEEYFNNIIVLMRASKKQDDMFWKKADSLLSFKEIRGTCLGYSNSGTSGNAIGSVLRKKTLVCISELLEAGDVDPVIFELLGVFQEKMGCDRISDLITYILKDIIISYNQRIQGELEIIGGDGKLAINPYNGEEILLLPKQILSPLPIAEEFSDIEFACSENQRVRDEVNALLDLGNRRKLKKEEIYYLLKSKLNFRNEIINKYKNITVSEYDFEKDPAGEYIWYAKTKEQAEKYPLSLAQPHNLDQVLDVVTRICDQFKKMIESNGLWRLLYNDNYNPKHESAAQLLFFGLADAYCEANNIDISREVNNGHGPVDFKLSKGYKNKVVVEIKLTSNSQLLHGIEVQLPLYMEQESTDKAIYLIIDNGHRKRLENFQDYYNNLDKKSKDKIPYYLIDGNIQESASKA